MYESKAAVPAHEVAKMLLRSNAQRQPLPPSSNKRRTHRRKFHLHGGAVEVAPHVAVHNQAQWYLVRLPFEYSLLSHMACVIFELNSP